MRMVDREAAILRACSSSAADFGSTAIQTGSGFDLAGSGCTQAEVTSSCAPFQLCVSAQPSSAPEPCEWQPCCLQQASLCRPATVRGGPSLPTSTAAPS